MPGKHYKYYSTIQKPSEIHPEDFGRLGYKRLYDIEHSRRTERSVG